LRKHWFISLIVLILFFGCQTVPVQESGELSEEQSEHIELTEDLLVEEPESRDYAETRPAPRSLDELTVAFPKYDMELDFRKSLYSHESQLFTAIYEGLFSYHPVTLEPVAALAESWTLSEDKMQWTFTIRRNARFSNGDPVRAEDFRAAWLSSIEPHREAPFSSFFDVIEGARDYRNGINTDPNSVGIRVISQRVLVVQLNSPASFFPAMLCHHSFSPIHSSMVNKDDWSLAPPVSNGPFKITSMDEDGVYLEKDNQYWDRQNVALNRLIIKYTEDGDDAARLWNSGEARWIYGSVNLDALTDHSGIQINVMFATHYYFIRGEQEPYNDARIRRAMALVLPWEELRSYYYLPAETLIYPVINYPAARGITEVDYEEARRLMADAGYEDGSGLPDLVIRVTPGYDAARVAVLMADAWMNILGFRVRMDVVPFERYYESLKEGGFTVGSTTWIGDFADPYAFLQMWRRDSNLNDALYNDTVYENLIDRSMMEEGAIRLRTLAEAEEYLLNSGTILPLCYNPALNIIDTGEIDGWYTNALDIHPFKYMSFRTFRPLPGVVMAQ